MKDIKIVKKAQITRNLVTESSFNNSIKKEPGVYTSSYYLSKFVLTGALFSVLSYVFIITSTVYYAVKEQKTIYAIENIPTADSFSYDNYVFKNTNKSNISYINKAELNSVTLK